MGEKQLDFFLGSLSPCGFRSYFAGALPPLESGTAVLLKGGPGCGKSTLLKRAAQALERRGETVHRIHCAADPDSLDGVLCPGRGLAILDATPPHALEARLPAAFEQVLSLDAALDSAALRPARAHLAQLCSQYDLLTERATRYIAAAGSLALDTLRTAACCTDTAKAARFAGALARRYLPLRERPAQEAVRLLSAVTPAGITVYTDTVSALASAVVVLDDTYGAAGQALMAALRREGLARGHDCITCLDPLVPDRIAHLLFPSSSVAFVTASPLCSLQFSGQRTIHASRFTNPDGLRLRRTRLRFNQKAARELLEQAGALLSEAAAVHHRIEAVYTAALDVSVLERLTGSLLASL